MRVLRIAALTALLLVGFAAPSSAASAVPIKGTVMGGGGPDVTAPGCEGAIWRFNGYGTGQMSHLGGVEYEFTHCTYPDLTADLGTFEFIAANGDELVMSYEGAFEVVGAGEGFTGEGSWTATGGTGRFANASGSGSWEVVGDVPGGDALFGLPDGYMEFTFDGKIAYAASDRSR